MDRELNWRKSSYSGSTQHTENCVEAAACPAAGWPSGTRRTRARRTWRSRRGSGGSSSTRWEAGRRPDGLEADAV